MGKKAANSSNKNEWVGVELDNWANGNARKFNVVVIPSRVSYVTETSFKHHQQVRWFSSDRWSWVIRWFIVFYPTKSSDSYEKQM